MLLGYKGEAELLEEMGDEAQNPDVHLGPNHVRALRALKAKKIVGATYFAGKINDMFAKYFERGRLRRARHGGHRGRVRRGRRSCRPSRSMPSSSRHSSSTARRDAIYLLGSGWRVLAIVDMLEQDLGVPVVHPVPARCWEIQKPADDGNRSRDMGDMFSEMVPG